MPDDKESAHVIGVGLLVCILALRLAPRATSCACAFFLFKGPPLLSPILFYNH